MSFARAIVAKSKSKHVNWAAFGVHLMKQKSIVRNVKQKATRIKTSKISAMGSKNQLKNEPITKFGRTISQIEE
jgi:hypothetical protein